MEKTDQQYIRPKDIDNRSTFRQRLMWRIESFAWDLIYWWPMKAIGPDRASRFLGWLMKSIAPLFSQNKTVKRNLKMAFPEKSDAEIDRIAAASWQSVGRTAGELPHLPKIHPYKGDRVEIAGESVLALVRLKIEYEEEEVYEVVDTDAVAWDAGTSFSSLPTIKMTPNTARSLLDDGIS